MKVIFVKYLNSGFILLVVIVPFLNGTIFQEEPKDFVPKFEVAACFLEYKDKILLLHRQDSKPQGNTWGIPGGKIDKDETPKDAVIREINEETGFQMNKEKLSDYILVYIEYPTYKYKYYMFKYKLDDFYNPDDVKINFHEHKSFTWATPKDALKLDLILDEDPCIRLFYKDQSFEN